MSGRSPAQAFRERWPPAEDVSLLPQSWHAGELEMSIQLPSGIRAAALWASMTLFLATVPAQAGGLQALAGVWELNVSKSTFAPGTEIKSQTRTYEVNGNVVKQSIESVDREGRHVRNQSVVHYDGKEYPLDDNPDADSISVKETGELTALTVLKQDGKVVQTVTRTLSADGKTCTFEYKGTNAKGKKIDNVLVFERH
jgi:hypothetical protein